MIKVLSVFGTRPEAIKMAPVHIELSKHPDKFKSIICVTGQHREMLDQVLNLFDIKPDYDLDLMKINQTPLDILSSILDRLKLIFDKVKPDWVLVQGDTATVLAASLAASLLKIKVGYVEAGLRSFDLKNPFPEELNRRLASVTAELHFAPTKNSKDNLLNENIDDSKIIITGNTVIDALKIVSKIKYESKNKIFNEIPLNKKIILVTAHRRENFGEPMKNILNAIKHIANKYPEKIHFVYPVHLNPNIKNLAFSILDNMKNVTLCEPLDYLPLVKLMKKASFILTDSGGIQEEAPTFGKPVLVLRKVTERVEAVSSGVAKIIGTDYDKIVSNIIELIEDEKAYNKMSKVKNPYGDGFSSKIIVKSLLNYEN